MRLLGLFEILSLISLFGVGCSKGKGKDSTGNEYDNQGSVRRVLTGFAPDDCQLGEVASALKRIAIQFIGGSRSYFRFLFYRPGSRIILRRHREFHACIST